ncbi:MAG: hypothetical protein M3Q39_12145 [Actinomycetota bacterium]|nr:hypothetical protein [Actinomycetota bacterium]
MAPAPVAVDDVDVEISGHSENLAIAVTDPSVVRTSPKVSSGELLLIDASTGGVVGRVSVDTGLQMHAALADASDQLMVAHATEKDSGRILRIDVRSGEVLAVSEIPQPWGSPAGLNASELLLDPSEAYLVLAHFVRAPDETSDSSTRHEFAVSLISATDLSVIDTYKPAGCADGRLSSTMTDLAVFVACPDASNVQSIPYSERGFDALGVETASTNGKGSVVVPADNADEAAGVVNRVRAALKGMPFEREPLDVIVAERELLAEAVPGDGQDLYVARRDLSENRALVNDVLVRMNIDTGEVLATRRFSEIGTRIRSFSYADGRLLTVAEDGRSVSLLDAMTLEELDSWTIANLQTPLGYITAGR